MFNLIKKREEQADIEIIKKTPAAIATGVFYNRVKGVIFLLEPQKQSCDRHFRV